MMMLKDRPVISRKRNVVAANKVDHLIMDALPQTKRTLPECGRYHAAVTSGVTPSSPAATNRTTLNLFAPAEPVRASSAPRYRPEQSFRLAPPVAADSRRRTTTTGTASTVSLTHEIVPARPTLTEWKRPSASIFLGGDSNQPNDRWTGRRPSPQRIPSSARVIAAAELPAADLRGLRSATRTTEGMRDILQVDCPKRTASLENRSALRTKIPPFAFDTPPTPRPSTNSRHVICVPQPSTVFHDRQLGGCFWDYKFSSIQKPASSALLQRRASTPEPRRICEESVLRSGKRRVVPAYLAA